MHRPVAVLLFSALGAAMSACSNGDGEASEVVWARGFGLRWAIANHRVSQAAVQPHADGVRASWIGGASTTGCVFAQGRGCVDQVPEDDTCLDATSCAELVFLDQTQVAVDRVRARADAGEGVALAEGSVELIADGEGGGAEATITLPYDAEGQAVAWIRGVALTTDVAMPEDPASCYDPRHGWLPDRISVAVGEPVAQGDRVWQVPVEARFGSGLSFEVIRTCLDALAGDAAAWFQVDLALAVGATARSVDVAQDASWERRETQALSDLGERSADVGPVAGWSKLDWRFHQEVDPGRGAYLRSLAAWMAPEEGRAWGVATNDSPTQLSGFDMAFEGEVVVFDEGLSLEEEGVWGLEDMPTTLDDEGRAIPQELQAPVEIPSFTQ